jgi:hypothetical protein
MGPQRQPDATLTKTLLGGNILANPETVSAMTGQGGRPVEYCAGWCKKTAPQKSETREAYKCCRSLHIIFG